MSFILGTLDTLSDAAQYFDPPVKLSNSQPIDVTIYNGNFQKVAIIRCVICILGCFILVSGILRKTNLTTVKQELYPNCLLDKNGNSTSTGCNKQTKIFNTTSYISQPCSGLNGECDSTIGLSCQANAGGTKICL